MARKKVVGTVQLDVEMLGTIQHVHSTTGLNKVELVRRLLQFLRKLNGVEQREVLGVNAEEIKRPDVVAILWASLRGDSPLHQSPEPAKPGVVEILPEEAARIVKEQRESRRKGRPKTGTD